MLGLVSGISADLAIGMATVVVSLGSAIHALELLVLRREFAPGGLYSWPVLRTFLRATLRAPVSYISDFFFGYPNYLVVIVIQFLASLMAVIQPRSSGAKWYLSIALAAQLLFHLRNRLGLGGADQMRVVVTAGCVTYHLAPDPWAKEACLWFVCLETILAYVTSGILKWISPVWRNGTAIAKLFRTETFGGRMLHSAATRFTGLSWLVCRATVVFECVLPVLVFCGPTMCLVFIGTGVMFHIGVAIVMGLNDFVWPYFAAYPILFYCSMDFQQYIETMSH